MPSSSQVQGWVIAELAALPQAALVRFVDHFNADARAWDSGLHIPLDSVKRGDVVVGAELALAAEVVVEQWATQIWYEEEGPGAITPADVARLVAEQASPIAEYR